MSPRKYSLTLFIAAVAFPLASHATPAHRLAPPAPAYNMVFLPAGFTPTAINNAGQIAGNLQKVRTDPERAFLLSGGKLKALGTLGGARSRANAINEAGDVTGTALTRSGNTHAFVYTRGRLYDVDKRQPGGSVGLAINAKREVVGQFSSTGLHAFLFSNNMLKDLGTLAAGTVSLAYGINDAGVIVGESDIMNSTAPITRAFVYRNGVMKDIGYLDNGPQGGADRRHGATAINNAGQVAGFSQVTGGALHLFLYSKDMMRDLGTFGGLNLIARDINERAMIVGYSDVSEGGGTGFLYANGKLRRLSELIDQSSGWRIEDAFGINDRGQIVGVACKQFDECRGVRLDPCHSHSQTGQDESGAPAEPEQTEELLHPAGQQDADEPEEALASPEPSSADDE